MDNAVSLPLANRGGYAELPAYRARMRVRAIEIVGYKPHAEGGKGFGATLMLGDNFAPYDVPASVVRASVPAAGDFLVILPDGTHMVLPRERFEIEYERV